METLTQLLLDEPMEGLAPLLVRALEAKMYRDPAHDATGRGVYRVHERFDGTGALVPPGTRGLPIKVSALLP